MPAALDHRHVTVDGLPIHVVEGGPPDAPALLFVHGWPECWQSFAAVMELMAGPFRVLALDLPGVGGSTVAPRAGDKRSLAGCVRGVIRAVGLRGVTLVGHDAGAQIVYAFLRAHPEDLQRAVIMNVAVPGVDPWAEVERNPHIWHFAFHAIPGLPERLVTGHQAAYFDHFFDALAARPEAIPAPLRQACVEAYTRPEALRAGFDWYRAFPQDARDNTPPRPVATPVLYLRGAEERGLGIELYLAGLRASGLRDLRGALVPGSGHFAPAEQPRAVARLLEEFVRG